MTQNPLRTFIPLIVIIFIDSLGHMISIPPFLRLFTEHSQSFMQTPSPAMINLFFSLCISIGSFGYVLGAPIMGTFSDSLGRKRTLVYSLLLSTVGFALPILGILSASLFWIIIGRFIAGIASSSQSLAQSAIADISKGTQKAWYFAMVATAMTLSLLVGPTIGAYLSDSSLSSHFNESTPFIITLGLIVVALILTLSLYSDKKDEENSTLSPKNPQKKSKKNTEKTLTLENFRSTIRETLSSKKIRLLFIIFFLYELGWSFYYQDIALYLTQNYGYTVTETAHFLVYAGIWMTVGLTCFYKMITRILPLHSVLKLSLGVCCFSFIACAYTEQPFYQWFFVAPGAVAVGMIYPTIMTLISDSVDKSKQGCILGFAAASFSAPWGISALLVGPLSTLSPTLPLILTALSLAFAFGLNLTLIGTPEIIEEGSSS